MKQCYILYARATTRHKWHIQAHQTNVTRILGNYQGMKQSAPTWEYALAVSSENIGDIASVDNVRAIPFDLLDIDAELVKPFEMVCPVGAQSDIGGAYSQHHLPVSVTWNTLSESGGYLECDCGARMGLYAELSQ